MMLSMRLLLLLLVKTGIRFTMLLKKIIIFVFIFYLFPFQATLASTSCAGKQIVLGFSKDWKQMYWDQEIAGECSTGNIIHVFDFEKQQDRIVSSLFDDSKPSHKKRYQALRQRIKNTLSLPVKRKTGNFINARCNFTSSIKLPRDDYLLGIKTIRNVYFNPTFQSWIVVSEECNSGDSEVLGGSCQYNAIYIVPQKSCLRKSKE
jgi:hypothetical protein